ncbi:MAG: Cyclopropane-fatty-acyl-phospholipid synthase [Chloroflexi bacterium]|nr:Cyclopropane-fatty-acyl-phospholipid synthase [Chloroflexota bacterium]
MTSKNSQTIIRELLEHAEIQVNGPHPWDIQIHDSRFYDRVLREVELGLGESYMDGWWDCEALDEFINRVLQARLDTKVKGNWKIMLHMLRAKLFNLQSPVKAYEIGEHHYDLGNDLYQAMLDKRLNYTCAYWKDASTLDEAQEAKLDLVCRKISLEPGMKVLELGCGWGSFAKYAAEEYGAEVLGVTVSKEQVELGMELCQGLPVELRLQDYREVEGQYDAVISIGVMEHVGYKNYRTYMEVVDRTLKPGGIAFIHTIGRNDSAVSGNAWTEKYIFPNGMLPSIAQLGAAMEGLFVMEDWHNFGPDYGKTLLAWHANFEEAWPELKSDYDERFRRMWRYYLLSSAGGFRSRMSQLWQMVMTRLGDSQPNCRFT